jgi:hypothetical protein
VSYAYLRPMSELVWLGSSVGTSERLKIVRSPVRSRPKPPITFLEFRTFTVRLKFLAYVN